MASAVLAGALALGGCYGEDGYEIPSRAMKELSPEMISELQQKNMPQDSPILIRLFKEESELEVWKQDTSGRYALLKVYPICRWSGALGPKVREGDRQAPEGFYQITPGLMNPNSNYYLAINTGFPNAYDRANDRHGAFLMIHGDCSSRGCYAMTDEEIGEIYSLAREAFLGGQKSFQIQAYPFRMTPANMAAHRNNPNLAFWKMIKEGYDHFDVTHLEPKIDVCGRHYVFDAVAPGNSNRPLNFTPTGACPKYQIDPSMADAVEARESHDEAIYAQLVSRNVATAPLDTGTDGGMNRVFASKLDNPAYTYDNEGHVHVPPQQPGRLPPALSPSGKETETTAAIASPPSEGGTTVRGFFGGLFGSKAAAEPAIASAEPPPAKHGLFASLFSNHDEEAAPAPAPQPAAAAPKARPSAVAGLRPRPPADGHKTEPQQAQTVAPKTDPQQVQSAPPKAAPAPVQQANAVMNGAQPTVPSGSFDNRWAGFQ